jgi:hypothetical protein
MSKRLSLLDILEEERGASTPSPATPPAQAPAQGAEPPTGDLPEEPPSAPSAPKRRAATKSDYLHLSITVSPELFERLQARSAQLRRERQPYTLSHLTRLALTEWLDRLESEEDPS